MKNAIRIYLLLASAVCFFPLFFTVPRDFNLFCASAIIFCTGVLAIIEAIEKKSA